MGGAGGGWMSSPAKIETRRPTRPGIRSWDRIPDSFDGTGCGTRGEYSRLLENPGAEVLGRECGSSSSNSLHNGPNGRHPAGILVGDNVPLLYDDNDGQQDEWQDDMFNQEAPNNNEEVENANRANPELAAGRTLRRRLIHNYFA
ncbi:hypothetical protein EAI_11372 [Harpegnathos saltator]|uniref:Uncharacterized protein n=1 Tax=Harpegnathos saltator TaxID=610380 RepID=E2C8D9_HARSA|nr:hypothetical protein EAI_11372 [Harpegnathos saltator]